MNMGTPSPRSPGSGRKAAKEQPPTPLMHLLPHITMSCLERHAAGRPAKLSDMCRRKLSQSFLKFGDIEKRLPLQDLQQIFSAVPHDVPATMAISRICNEDYFRERSKATFPLRSLSVVDHGNSWKQLFLELTLQQELENMGKPDWPSNVDIKELTTLCRAFVFSLSLNLQRGAKETHAKVVEVIDSLPNLCRITLRCADDNMSATPSRELGVGGLTLPFARSLAVSMRRLQMLTSVNLSSNLINDRIVRVLCKGFEGICTLRDLDLAHNKISDRGAHYVAQMLDESTTLSTLSLRDNLLHDNGLLKLGATLEHNNSLQRLDVSLNRVGDTGASAMFKDLRKNTSLTHLSLSSNAITEASEAALELLLRENRTLEHLDLSGNGVAVPEGVPTQCKIDVRRCLVVPSEEEGGEMQQEGNGMIVAAEDADAPDAESAGGGTGAVEDAAVDTETVVAGGAAGGGSA
ncbi:unnamed protein product [Vitrella brassicaformis CCMP3155]|uniref:F-box domain-containing protein n=2 Tax=Vitrella brassicaformis TaxID=1169539 RepID=A0A0G4ENP0_VITBC|nr:unnamed protein product [Vitrella brassicaformis CCMP3155]|eukprot:CEL98572.1 unnamed protein product [Vitrella brassicaformis CCMP3155]